MNGYRGVFGETFGEKIIERSRFLTYISRVCTEEEAKKYLMKVRGEHPFATHVCYGYVADRAGNLQRFSDDGEPQGTAGMPILGVLKAQSLRESLIAVVRYFGGIKLGAGGLTRAYAGCAAETLALSKIYTFAPCVEYELTVSYSDVNAALRFLERENVVSRNFSDVPRFTVAVRESEEENFLLRLKDFFNGNIHAVAGDRKIYPFDEK